MTQEEKNTLLAEAIGCLMKAYAMNSQEKVLDQKSLESIESVIDTYMNYMRNKT